MTPIIGLLVAVVAGFAASSRREVLIGMIPPMLAATAAQSWYLGSGRGHNSPATTTDDPAYWIVQLIILALVGGVAMGIYAVRARRVSRRGGSLVPVRREPGSWMLAAATVAAEPTRPECRRRARAREQAHNRRKHRRMRAGA